MCLGVVKATIQAWGAGWQCPNTRACGHKAGEPSDEEGVFLVGEPYSLTHSATHSLVVAEAKRLREENERLSEENERLREENERLVAAQPSTPPWKKPNPSPPASPPLSRRRALPLQSLGRSSTAHSTRMSISRCPT